jgi:outer membrane protein TolC
MIRFALTIITVVCATVVTLVGQTLTPVGDSLTLQKVISEVVSKNDRVAAMRFMEKAAAAKAGSAGTWDDPMLMLGVSNLPTSLDFKMDPMTMRMLGLSMSIPYAGQKGLQRQAARAEALAAVQDRMDMELELATAAKLAFCDLYFSTSVVALIMKQIEVTQDIVASVRSGISTSQTNPEDAMAAQADLWRLQTQLGPAAHEVESAQYELNALRGHPTTQPVGSPGLPQFSELPDSVGELIAAAREHYPPLKKLGLQSRSYSLSGAAERRMRWPMLELAGSYNYRASTEMEKRDNMINVQATFSLPIFSHGKQTAMSKSMDLMSRSVETEAIQLGREIETRVRALFLDALHLKENLLMYRNRVIPADEDAYRYAFAGYAASRTQLSTVLNFALTNFRDQLAANSIEYELARTMAEIERYTTDPAVLPGALTESNK